MIVSVLTGSFAESIPVKTGGIQIAEISAAEGLAQLLAKEDPKYFIRIVANSKPGQLSYEQLLKKLELFRIHNGLTYQETTGIEYASQFASIASSLISRWSLQRQIKIVQHSSAIPALTCTNCWLFEEILRKQRNLRFVYVAHNSLYLTDYPQYIFRDMREEWNKYRFAEVYAIKNADIVITASEWFKQRIIKVIGIDPNKIKVIPNTVGPSSRYKSYSPFKSKAFKNCKIVLFIGRLAEEKNVDVLIKAITKVFTSVPESSLFLCGDGPLKSKLISLCHKLNLPVSFDFSPKKGTVHFVGNISGERKWKLYKSSAVFCCLSDIEVSPLVGYEALACGIPIIASNIPPWQELISEGQEGFLVNKEDNKSLANKLIEILINTDLSKRMQLSALEKYSKNYDAQIVANIRWDEVYKPLLSE